MKEFLNGVVFPVLLAGLLGGLGSYVAVRIDIAVLKNNQAEMKSSLAVISDLQERTTKGEAKDDFLQYQIDMLKDKEKTAYIK